MPTDTDVDDTQITFKYINIDKGALWMVNQ